jgi:hypothetical protein
MLTFDEPSHTYKWNGTPVPSVTTILSPLIDYSMVNPEVLERGRQLGSAVHRMTELHDLDDLDESSLSPDMKKYLIGWKKFREDTGFVPDTIEKRMFHPKHHYCGTSDRTGVIRGQKAVIDIKKMMSLGAVIGVQLAAYQAMHNLEDAGITHRYALGLRPDGTYRLQQFNNPSDFAVFLSLLNIRNWKAKNGN